MLLNPQLLVAVPLWALRKCTVMPPCVWVCRICMHCDAVCALWSVRKHLESPLLLGTGVVKPAVSRTWHVRLYKFVAVSPSCPYVGTAGCGRSINTLHCTLCTASCLIPAWHAPVHLEYTCICMLHSIIMCSQAPLFCTLIHHNIASLCTAWSMVP